MITIIVKKSRYELKGFVQTIINNLYKNTNKVVLVSGIHSAGWRGRRDKITNKLMYKLEYVN